MAGAGIAYLIYDIFLCWWLAAMDFAQIDRPTGPVKLDVVPLSTPAPQY